MGEIHDDLERYHVMNTELPCQTFMEFLTS